MSDKDVSIHPYGRPARNTSKPHQGKGKLAARRKRLSDRRTAHAALLKTLPAKVANAFRVPGSMNQHKR